MDISIIIPCYNEEKNIKEVARKVKENLNNISHEIIFIDDGSKDSTLQEIKQIYQEQDNINIISFSKNYGQDYAILAGLRNSNSKYVTIIDADMQQDPKYIVEMYNILEKNKEYDIVAAYPKKEKKINLFL